MEETSLEAVLFVRVLKRALASGVDYVEVSLDEGGAMQARSVISSAWREEKKDGAK